MVIFFAGLAPSPKSSPKADHSRTAILRKTLMQIQKKALLLTSLLGFSILALPRLRGSEVLLELIRVEGRVPVAMRDGVKLYADIYRPRREGKFPVLVVRTPYGVQRDGMHESKIRFAQSGYAVVIQDTRGRYESEGKWEPFRNE